MQAFDRDTPLPEERLSLLFDIGAPAEKVTLEEMPDEVQVCNCNGVTKGAIGACVSGGMRNASAVMKATRGGMGCGSCKGLINELVDFYCGGNVEEDPSIHYYVPGVPLPTAELIEAITANELKSVSSIGLQGAGRRQGRSRQQARSRRPAVHHLEERVRGRARRQVHQ